jgi:DNA polymerase III delta prime subunit
MSYTFRKAVRTNTSTLISLAGPSGSGKTYSAIRLARGLVGEQGKMVLIDTEAGRALHYADTFNFDHYELRPPFSPENYALAVKAAEESGYTAIIVDSMSHEWAGDGGCQDMHDEAHEKLGNTEQTNILAWRDAKLDHKRMVSRFLQSHSHLIFCLRAEEKIKFTKDATTGKTQIVPQGWMPICEKNFQYEMTVSFMLTDEKPGYGKPIKLQEQHKPFFDLTKPLDEQAGRKLAEWANGGTVKRREDGLDSRVATAQPGDVHPASQDAHASSTFGADHGIANIKTAPTNAELDAAIEQQDLENEYRDRFKQVVGPDANRLYKELTSDARVTKQTKDNLYKDYTDCLKTQQVKR